MPRAAPAHAKAIRAAIPLASGHRIAPSPQPVAVRCQRRGVKPVTCAKTRTVRLLLVGAPDYFERHGHPAHPRDLARHRALRYTHARVGDAWRFHHRVHGDFSQVVPAALQINNAEALVPALRAGLGLAMQPEFLAWDDLREGRVQCTLADWEAPSIALHLVTPPGRAKPARVQSLIAFLADHFARAPWAADAIPATATATSTA